VVNSADIVPRLSPTLVIEVATLVLRWIPAIPYNRKIADFLEKFRHYRHYGDLRYMTAGKRIEPPNDKEHVKFDGLQVIPNPAQFSRWFWLWGRLLETRGRAAVADHSIATYVEKLAHWGWLRTGSPPVPPPAAGDPTPEQDPPPTRRPPEDEATS
jgi:triacylglycerol lipase